MRLWTIHPRYLDTKALVAVWREGLLAQKVLRGKTRGYTRHPQLHRFQAQKFPLRSIATYLSAIANEAGSRGYKFDRRKIPATSCRTKIIETRGQLIFEWAHLKRKLRSRSPQAYRICCKIDNPRAHPLFRIVAGPIQDWEKGNALSGRVNRASRAHESGRKSRVSSRS